jgi:pilus assembly protein CpaC
MLTVTKHQTATGAMKGSTMKRLVLSLLTATAAAAPLALVPASPVAAQAVSRPANDIVLSIGRGQLVTVGGSMADVFVADDKVADVQVKDTNQLYVFGKAGGETTVYASNSRGDVIWSANIRVGSNIDSVDQMMRMAMPDAKVTVSTMGTNTFLLTGWSKPSSARKPTSSPGSSSPPRCRSTSGSASPRSAAPWCATSAPT